MIREEEWCYQYVRREARHDEIPLIVDIFSPLAAEPEVKAYSSV
jgi:hypothetical protein